MAISKHTGKEKERYYGGGPFKGIKYCVRCCLPDTQEGVSFDEMGMCTACRSSECKMHIDWAQRREQLAKILDIAKEKAKEKKTYDIMVPISGGKDSCFQLHVLKKIYNMHILAVTFNHNWYSETGKYNLWNILEKLDIDHMMFTPNKEAISKIAKESLYQIGDACWHCHAGVGSFPLRLAVQLRIPLMVYGESAAEIDGRATYENIIPYDKHYYTTFSAKKYPHEMLTKRSGLTEKDMRVYELPSDEEIQEAGVTGIHLGDYYYWDEMRQVEFLAKEYDWRQDEIEGTYKKYKSVECKMVGVHDYMKFIKRGYGRTTDHASEDIRQGLMTRDEGKDLIHKLDGARPDELDEYLKMCGITEKEFHEILESHREGNAKKLPKYSDYTKKRKDE